MKLGEYGGGDNPGGVCPAMVGDRDRDLRCSQGPNEEQKEGEDEQGI